MEKSLSVEIVPVGEGSLGILKGDHDCSALLINNAINWKKAALEIRWDAAEKTFFVEFNGKAAEVAPNLNSILSKRVPLQIARTSRCECGSTLSLGDYTVTMKDSDFKFHAEYFCPACKVHLIAEKRGLKKILETWFSSLKRLEIKASGVRIERAVGSPRATPRNI
jgi:hypothetical protein